MTEQTFRKPTWGKTIRQMLVGLVLLLAVACPERVKASDTIQNQPVENEYVPPDFSEECPSSAERAKPWGAARLLKPEDLTGPLAFLAVPYPQRDFEEAQKLFEKAYPALGSAAKVAADLGAYRETPEMEKISTRYPPGYTEMPWHLLRHYTIGLPTEQVYRFVVDEGCGALTVWRVGVFSRMGRITKTRVRRTFDDYDFSRRKIPFRIRDFDQQVYLPMVLGHMDRTLRSLIKGAENDAEALRPILEGAGEGVVFRESINPKRSPDTRIFGATYHPSYRDRQQKGWVITITTDADGGLKQQISSGAPDTLWVP